MTGLIIVTNNPRLQSGKYKNVEIEKKESLEDVLRRARDLVHQGAELITHPLAGSLKPWQNPYRSLGLKEGEKLDQNSLEIMENVLERHRTFARDGRRSRDQQEVNEDLKEEFSRIDLDFIGQILPEELAVKSNSDVRGEKIEA